MLARRLGVLRGGIHHWKVELGVVRPQLHQQVEDLVQHLDGPLLGTVDLVHDQDRPQAVLEGLAQHETRLGHHPFDGIHEQQHGIDHAEDTFDLTAEVGVARRVDELDLYALELDGGALRLDGNAALALQVARVHHALGHLLVFPERSRIGQKTVDQGGLPVVDVRDDREVSQIFAVGRLGHGSDLRSKYARTLTRGSARSG